MEAWQNGFGIVAVDQREALFSCAVVETPPDNASGRLVLRGLNPNASYRVNVVWPQQFSADAHRDTHSTDGADASGDALMREGIPVTDLRPQELLIFHLQG